MKFISKFGQNFIHFWFSCFKKAKDRCRIWCYLWNKFSLIFCSWNSFYFLKILLCLWDKKPARTRANDPFRIVWFHESLRSPQSHEVLQMCWFVRNKGFKSFIYGKPISIPKVFIIIIFLQKGMKRLALRLMKITFFLPGDLRLLEHKLLFCVSFQYCQTLLDNGPNVQQHHLLLWPL